MIRGRVSEYELKQVNHNIDVLGREEGRKEGREKGAMIFSIPAQKKTHAVCKTYVYEPQYCAIVSDSPNPSGDRRVLCSARPNHLQVCTVRAQGGCWDSLPTIIIIRAFPPGIKCKRKTEGGRIGSGLLLWGWYSWCQQSSKGRARYDAG